MRSGQIRRPWLSLALKWNSVHFTAWSVFPAECITKLFQTLAYLRKAAAYGYFGRSDEDLSREKTDKAEVLKLEARKL